MNIALIFAGGVGSRMGNDTPKQFLTKNGKAILIHTLLVFEQQEDIDGIVIACKKNWIDYTWQLIKTEGLQKVVSIVPGGETALASQYNALEEIRKLYGNSDIAVLIHDGVRPLIDKETIHNCIETTWQYGNAITVTEAIETVITIDESENVTSILDRNVCCMAKAPQCFMLHDILNVHEQAIQEDRHYFIDSVSMMMAYGYKMHIVIGKPENIKITTPSDYYMFLGISQSEKETDP